MWARETFCILTNVEVITDHLCRDQKIIPALAFYYFQAIPDMDADEVK